MEICTCKSCRYTFRCLLLPVRCPDCGAEAVRKATAREIRDYRHIQRILEKEIRTGLWAGG